MHTATLLLALTSSLTTTTSALDVSVQARFSQDQITPICGSVTTSPSTGLIEGKPYQKIGQYYDVDDEESHRDLCLGVQLVKRVVCVWNKDFRSRKFHLADGYAIVPFSDKECQEPSAYPLDFMNGVSGELLEFEEEWQSNVVW